MDHRERAENKSHAGQSDLYFKNKSNFFLWQVQSGASLLHTHGMGIAAVAAFLHNRGYEKKLRCTYRKQWNEDKINTAVEEVIRKLATQMDN